ncbi:MAG: homoserine O-acetyltransferase [Pseudomonadota bacterium]|nr:homoserine O-acetyltransferase [Pseudomonadota bacterium]
MKKINTQIDKAYDSSVGLVTSKNQKFNTALKLDSGTTLENYNLRYETYGELNGKRNNAVLVCHALTGDQHAAGFNNYKEKKPGWWDNMIGPGKPVDTTKFFVVCPNNLGGCGGSTGPLSQNPRTGKPYGPDFPIITVRDWVESQKQLTDKLGIESWAAVMGGSLGGMQAIQWAIDYPERVRHALIIAAAPKLSTQNIAFNEIARQAIRSDPNYHNGLYADKKSFQEHGLKLARMVGHLTYLSDDILHTKFGRELKKGKIEFGFDVEFEIESYLKYQGESFIGQRFDPNSYLLMTKTLDYFDPAEKYQGKLSEALKKCKSNFLVISFSSDWRFSPARSMEIVRALLENDKNVVYSEIDSELGHDSFLLPIPQYHRIISTYLKKVILT